MKYVDIAGMKLSRIALGTDYYGTARSVQVANSLMDTYFEAGGNLLDTARMYCGGESERIIGSWIKGRRDKVFISTKCAHPPLEDMSVSRLSPADIESDVDASLAALGTDYIDILWLHRDDARISVDEIMDTLHRLIAKGKVRAAGASNWRSPRISKANAYALAGGMRPFIASQIRFSPARVAINYEPTLVDMDKEEYAFYSEAGMPVFAFAPQAKGFFAKYKRAGSEALDEKTRERYLTQENITAFHSMNALAKQMNLSISAAVVAALVSNPCFTTIPILGCSNAAQLCDSLSGADSQPIDYFDFF